MCVIFFQNQSFLFWSVRYRITLSGSVCVGQVIALDHASIELESNKERNPTIMYTDSERAEKCSRQAQDSLFLTFFHALSCYAIFHITCHIRWTQPQPLGGHQFCGEQMLANVDSLIVKMNNGLVTNVLLAFLFSFGEFTSCTYVHIYIYVCMCV